LAGCAIPVENGEFETAKNVQKVPLTSINGEVRYAILGLFTNCQINTGLVADSQIFQLFGS
jgi:hypothetical protein